MQQVGSISFEDGYHRIRFNAHGDQLVCTGWDPESHTVYRFDVGADGKTGTLTQTERDRHSLNSSVWSPSGNTLAWLRTNDQAQMTLKTVTVYGENAKATELEVEGRSTWSTLAALTDHSMCIQGDDLRLHRWDMQSRSVKKSAQKVNGPLVASPDGRFVLARRTIFSMETMEPIFTFPSLGGECWCVDWSRDGRYIAIGSRGGKAATWDLIAMDRRLRRLGLPTVRSGGAIQSDTSQLTASKSDDLWPQPLISQPAPFAACTPLEKLRERRKEPIQSLDFPAMVQQDVKQKSLMLDDDYFDVLKSLGERGKHSPNYLAEQLVSTAQRVERLTATQQSHVVRFWHEFLADPDDCYTETQRQTLLKNIIRSYEALEQPETMTKSLAVIAYLERGKHLKTSEPDSLAEATKCYATAYSLVHSLSEAGEFTKATFSSRWYWLLHAYASAEAGAGHRERAIELMREAMQFSRQSGYDPGVGFRREAEANLKRWSDLQKPRLPADVDWLKNWRFYSMKGAKGGGKIVEEELHLTTTVAGTEEYNVHATQPMIFFEEDAEYVCSFEARSPEPRSVTVEAALGQAPWAQIGLKAKFKTATEYQTYNFKFRTRGTAADCRHDDRTKLLMKYSQLG